MKQSLSLSEKSKKSAFIRIKSQRVFAKKANNEETPKLHLNLDVISMEGEEVSPHETVVVEFLGQKQKFPTNENGVAKVVAEFDCVHQELKDKLRAWIEGSNQGENQVSEYDIISPVLQQAVDIDKKSLQTIRGTVKILQEGKKQVEALLMRKTTEYKELCQQQRPSEEVLKERAEKEYELIRGKEVLEELKKDYESAKNIELQIQEQYRSTKELLNQVNTEFEQVEKELNRVNEEWEVALTKLKEAYSKFAESIKELEKKYPTARWHQEGDGYYHPYLPPERSPLEKTELKYEHGNVLTAHQKARENYQKIESDKMRLPQKVEEARLKKEESAKAVELLEVKLNSAKMDVEEIEKEKRKVHITIISLEKFLS